MLSQNSTSSGLSYTSFRFNLFLTHFLTEKDHLWGKKILPCSLGCFFPSSFSCLTRCKWAAVSSNRRKPEEPEDTIPALILSLHEPSDHLSLHYQIPQGENCSPKNIPDSHSPDLNSTSGSLSTQEK